ncbi:MAG: hypothetical protein VXY31_00485 [Candidatus Thermoplasmatota archaeon]|nr:hypothetical protein [Candidatus Thermoplasmatota archaeon]
MDLPTPYAESEQDESSISSAMERRIQSRDKWRGRWTKLTTNPVLRYARYSLAFALPISIIASSAFLDSDFLNISRIMWLTSTILFIPPLVASSYARMAAKDRLELRRQGFSLRESYVGVDRILNQLEENKLRERTRVSAAVVGLILASTVSSAPLQTDLSLTLLGLTAILSIVILFATISIEKQKSMDTGKTPLLKLHTPSLHDTLAEPLLVDLVYAHLDPETSSRWNIWIEKIGKGVRRQQQSEDAIETVLRAIYLSMLEEIDQDEKDRICAEVLNTRSVEQLRDEKEPFNFEQLETLLEHVIERKPGLFRLLSRTIQRASRLRQSETWILDADLPPRAMHGESDLFVLASPDQNSSKPLEIDIITVEGEPEVQMIRLPPIDRSVRPGRTDGEDAWIRFNTIIDNSHILWIGMAWNKSGHEGRSVQVNLLTENEITIKSLVLWTIMEDGDGFLFSTIRNAVKEVYSMVTRTIIR